jgi:hypothetical protein
VRLCSWRSKLDLQEQSLGDPVENFHPSFLVGTCRNPNSCMRLSALPAATEQSRTKTPIPSEFAACRGRVRILGRISCT